METSEEAEGLVLPNQRKIGYGDLCGDCWELGGKVGMFSGDRLRWCPRRRY